MDMQTAPVGVIDDLLRTVQGPAGVVIFMAILLVIALAIEILMTRHPGFSHQRDISVDEGPAWDISDEDARRVFASVKQPPANLTLLRSSQKVRAGYQAGRDWHKGAGA